MKAQTFGYRFYQSDKTEQTCGQVSIQKFTLNKSTKQFTYEVNLDLQL
jgi:hypothetical protein